MEHREFATIVDSWLTNIGWFKGTCTTCGNQFYSTQVRRLSCSSPICGELLPSTLPAPNSFDSLGAFWGYSSQWFQQRKLEIVCRRSLVNDIGSTYFVGSGLQYFDDVVFLEKPPTNMLYVVAQPAIRLNYLGRAGVCEGFSTAFLNLCTEQIVNTFDAYFAHLALWLKYLQDVGIRHEVLSITLSPSLWSPSVFRGWSLVFNYEGIELGDAIYVFDVKQKTRTNLSIVDFSFGLERIFWASTRNPSYFESIGPSTDATADFYVKSDLLRTATLMVLSEVKPSSRKCGRLLRNLIRRATPLLGPGGPELCVKHSHGYWHMFLTSEISAAICVELIEKERARIIVHGCTENQHGGTPRHNTAIHQQTRGASSDGP